MEIAKSLVFWNTMKTLGFNEKIEELIDRTELAGFELARIIVEHKERYIIQTESNSYHAEITGNLRFSAQSRVDFPAVGDWVKFTKMDEQNAIILQVLPRFSVLERRAVGQFGEVQIIASNIDFAFVVQSVGHDFNLKRLERYLAICHSAKIKPYIILTKTDLIESTEISRLTQNISERIKDVEVIPLSNQSKSGFDRLNSLMKPFKTYCFLGSSGVGKSTIINHLNQHEVLKTKAVSDSTNKGRHTTSHRELFILPNKSIVVDTPGMREIGLTDLNEGLETTYDQISELAKSCKYADCRHINESGCAILDAVDNGELLEDVLINYQKLKREQEHFSSSVHEKRKKSKEFGKMIKTVLNEKKRRNSFDN